MKYETIIENVKQIYDHMLGTNVIQGKAEQIFEEQILTIITVNQWSGIDISHICACEG